MLFNELLFMMTENLIISCVRNDKPIKRNGMIKRKSRKIRHCNPFKSQDKGIEALYG